MVACGIAVSKKELEAVVWPQVQHLDMGMRMIEICLFGGEKTYGNGLVAAVIECNQFDFIKSISV